MTNEDIVQRLREDYCQCVNEPEYKPIRCYTCEAADLIEALEAELSEAKKVFSETFDAARKWRAKSEALEAEVKRLRDALQGLHDDVAEYQSINNLGGYNNHWMVIAHKALEQ